jgi:uncharacterized surface protein with fasciclin (FAS1) repeats
MFARRQEGDCEDEKQLITEINAPITKTFLTLLQLCLKASRSCRCWSINKIKQEIPMFKSSLIALSFTIGLGAVSALASNPMVGGSEMFPVKNIIENAVNSKDHTTLVAAVKAAGLVETLQGAGPFTVFAPTNDAFAALPAGTVDGLLKPEAKATLTKVLTCHVIAANAMSDAVMKMVDDDGGMHKVKTVGGCELTLKYKDGKVLVEDETGGIATVTIADVAQSNGVIHVIDKVLLPKM